MFTSQLLQLLMGFSVRWATIFLAPILPFFDFGPSFQRDIDPTTMSVAEIAYVLIHMIMWVTPYYGIMASLNLFPNIPVTAKAYNIYSVFLVIIGMIAAFIVSMFYS